MGRFFGMIINGIIDLLSNNNVRLALLWLVIISHGTFNFAVVGFGPAATPSYEGMSAERQEALKSLNPRVFESPDQDWYGGKFRFWSWLLWLFFELPSGIIYFPIAFRDEVKREAGKAIRTLREERGRTPPQEQQRPAGTAITARPQHESSLSWFSHASIWLAEITDIVLNLFLHKGK